MFLARLNWNGSALSKTYSTYLGGSGDDVGSDLVVDGTSQVVLTGWTASTNFPVAGSPSAPLRTTKAGGTYDAFVARINTVLITTSQLVSSAYLGGSSDDYGYDVAVDSANQAAVVGQALSANFPNVCQVDASGLCGIGGLPAGGNVFVTKLDATGTSPVYTVYLGNGGTRGYAIAMDGSGAAAITGAVTNSIGLQTVTPIQGYGGGSDAFVAKISGTPTAIGTRTLLYSYDGLLRLTTANELPGVGYGYAYDLAGNRTDVTVNGAATTTLR